MIPNRVMEIAAEEVHLLWIEWAGSVQADLIDSERKERWKTLFVPYSDLPESEKEKDREVVRRLYSRVKRKL